MTIQERVRMTQGKRDTAIFEQLCGVPSGVIKKLYNGEIVSGVIKAVAKFAEMPVSEYMRNVDMRGLGVTPAGEPKYPPIPKDAPAETPKEQPKEEPEAAETPVRCADESNRDFAKRLLKSGYSLEDAAKIAGYSSPNFLKAAIAKSERPTIEKVKEKPMRAPRNQTAKAQPKKECTEDLPQIEEMLSIIPESAPPRIIPSMYKGQIHSYDLRDDAKTARVYDSRQDSARWRYSKEELLVYAAELTELAEKM